MKLKEKLIIKMKSKNVSMNSLSKGAYLNETFFVIMIHLMYKYIGRKLLQNKKIKLFFYNKLYNKKYETILQKANLKVLPEEYFIFINIFLIFLLFLMIFFTVFFFFINSLYSIILFYGGILFVSLIGIFFYNYPIVLAKSRGDNIDASMPYLLPYLKILSKEINLSKIINIIDDFLIYKEIKEEFRKIKYYSDFLGYDVHSSVKEAMQSCPSRQLSDLMNDLVTISNSGGDIYLYLSRKLENLNSEIEALEKKNIDTLLIFSQIYVVLLLISPLFFTIMSSILNLIELSSVSGGGVSDNGTIVTIVGLLFILPIAYLFFMVLIYYTKPLYSRLVPIKND